MTELISIRVSIAYGQKPPVLRDVHLGIFAGEILGLVGHSGCGKSSLALALLGLASLKGARVSGSILSAGVEVEPDAALNDAVVGADEKVPS